MDIRRQPNQAATQGEGHQARHRGPRRPIAFLVLTVVFIFILFGSVLIAALYMKSTGDNKVTPDASKFQAVFMTNGQVYFGKLTNTAAKYQTLTDVYYLQVQQSVQPSTTNKAAADANSSQISLTKLGNELHGPTDRMNISSDQVLFWEDMSSNSTIVKAIKDYQAKQ